MTFTINNKCLLKNTFTEVHTLSHSVREALPTRHGQTRHSQIGTDEHGTLMHFELDTDSEYQHGSKYPCVIRLRVGARQGSQSHRAPYNIVNSYARFFPGPGRRSSNCHSTSTLVFNTLLLVVCELFHI